MSCEWMAGYPGYPRGQGYPWGTGQVVPKWYFYKSRHSQHLRIQFENHHQKRLYHSIHDSQSNKSAYNFLNHLYSIRWEHDRNTPLIFVCLGIFFRNSCHLKPGRLEHDLPIGMQMDAAKYQSRADGSLIPDCISKPRPANCKRVQTC